MNRLRSFAILCAAFALVCVGVRAQNAISTGSISGQVTDTSGGAVVGATVTAVNEAAGVKLTTKTNGTGFYSFPSLGVGAYDISVSQTGFKTAIANGVLVQVGQNAAANVALQVGQIAESVTVTAEVPLLRLPRKIKRIDGNAVSAKARTGIKRMEAERLGRSGVNHFPDV